MKVLSVGDVHGRDIWKFHTHGSSYEYNHWKVSVDHGADPNDSKFWEEYQYAQVDRIIFVGDYVDSFDKTNEQILRNLEEIIEFKKALGDKVVLLLGNHDIQYIIPNEICSGFRSEMQFDLARIFKENLHLFKLVHLEKGTDGSKWLWSHAGVSSGWYEKDLLRDMNNSVYRFYDIVQEFLEVEREVDEIINKAFELKVDCLWNVDSYSGGYSVWAGPIWVRPYVLNHWPLTGYNQIVGHTTQGHILSVSEDGEKAPFNGFKHFFVDVPYLDQDPLILEI
jgi:hypothetical protein